MRLRLFGLLLIAAACTWFAAAVAAAGAEQPPVAKPAPKQARASALRCPLPKQARRAFERAARDTELPLALLTAVARIESAQAPSNVLAGARYLRLMLERFHSTDLALAAYNAGPTAVARAGGAPSAEVLTYVANVTRLWRRLQGCK
jgi:soluble lytic murein transglycosylase-like protein